MSDEDALLAAIRAFPDDDTPRLVYADWLDDHDDARSAIVRAEVQIGRMDPDPFDVWLITVGRIKYAYRGWLRKQPSKWTDAIRRTLLGEILHTRHTRWDADPPWTSQVFHVVCGVEGRDLRGAALSSFVEDGRADPRELVEKRLLEGDDNQLAPNLPRPARFLRQDGPLPFFHQQGLGERDTFFWDGILSSGGK